MLNQESDPALVDGDTIPIGSPPRRFAWLDSPYAYAMGAPVMSLLGAATTLLAPMLLDPVSFGTFTLMAVLFQNATSLDLGLSQLSDKILAENGMMTLARAEELVQARWVIAMAVGAVLLPTAALGAIVSGHFTPGQAAIAICAGLAMMIANGRVIAFRSMSFVREFTASALLLQAGMTLPRLLGLLVAGVNGCFVGLALWFGTLALSLAKPKRLTRETVAATALLVRLGLPLFAFSGLWLVFTLSSRWISASLSDQHEFGLFAFGANLSFIAIAMLGTITQVLYPKIIVAFHKSPEDGSRILGRDVIRLTMALTVAVAVGILSAGTAIDRLFPAFGEAHAATVVIGISCIPLGVAVWMLPISIAFTTSPVSQSALVFIPPLLALGLGMVLGNVMNGIVGQSWACVGAAFLLVGTLNLHMRRIGILDIAVCRRIVLVLSGSLGACIVLAVTTGNATAIASMQTARPVPPGWELSFRDEFDRLDLWNGASGTWEPHYPWGARSNNDELQYYVDPRPGRDRPELAAFDPFRVRDGILDIRANRIPGRLTSATEGRRYTSGLLSTAKSFTFTYGHVEVKARIPSGQGLWPALWLIPADQSWPPEIDVMEALGHRTSEYWATVHSGRASKPSKTAKKIGASDLSADFHVFGMTWTADEVTWHLDGNPVFTVSTPSDMHKPMYLVMNLAIGGQWPGPPDDATPFPSAFEVDHVRVYTPPHTTEKKETTQ